MSEQSSEYDPMSLQPGVDEIYSSPEIIEHIRVMRSISQEATRRRAHAQRRMRAVETIHAPELFGSRGKEGIHPPINPLELNNNTAAEDVLPVVENS